MRPHRRKVSGIVKAIFPDTAIPKKGKGVKKRGQLFILEGDEASFLLASPLL